MRMYVVVDEKLSAGAKIAQSGHALVEFGRTRPDLIEHWQTEGNTLIVLEGDESALLRVWTWALKRGSGASMFQEPDFNKAVTAVAVYCEPGILTFPLAKSKGAYGERKARKREAKMRKINRTVDIGF